MGYDLNLDVSAKKARDIFKISQERAEILDKLMAHARIEAITSMDWIKKCALEMNTPEELVLVVYTIGLRAGE